MTVTTQRTAQPQIRPSVQTRQRKSKKTQAAAGALVAPSLKASLIGGFGILMLMSIRLIQIPNENLPFLSIDFLVIPGFLVVCLATGLLAGIFAGDSIKNSHEGGKAGWLAGFWAGILGGVAAMLFAAFGFLMAGFGLGIVSQITPESLTTLAGYGMSTEAIALAGRVVGALIVYGLIGSLVTGLLSSIGGMLYPKLTH